MMTDHRGEDVHALRLASGERDALKSDNHVLQLCNIVLMRDVACYLAELQVGTRPETLMRLVLRRWKNMSTAPAA